jgi:hypothetical protein
MEPNNDSENKPNSRKKRRKLPASKPSKKNKLEKKQALSAFFESPEYTKHCDDTRALEGAIGEYLSSYIVIGYMTNGKPVATTHACNQRDLDALNTSLQKFIFESYAHRNFPPGSFEE